MVIIIITREMKIRVLMSYHFTSTKMTIKIIDTTISKLWKKALCIAGENVQWSMF